jgi:hypothetical protein
VIIALFVGAAALVGGPPLANVYTGTAQGAVAMKRVSVTCVGAGTSDHHSSFGTDWFRTQQDPIVAFGQPVSAHLHDVCGNRAFSSTYSANTYPIVAGHEADPGYAPAFSNYPTYGWWPAGWNPAAVLNGVTTTPDKWVITWQAPVGVHVDPAPFGAAMVAGDSHATVTPKHVRFTCGGNTNGLGGGLDGPGSPTPIDCTNVPGGVVTGEITFPDCWDGLGTSRPDPLKQWQGDAPYGININHFSYSVDGKCTGGMIPCVTGKLIAQLVTQETWIDNRQTLSNGAVNPDFNKPLRNPLNVDGSMALSFSSGPASTYHGDHIETSNHEYPDTINVCLNNQQSTCPFGTKFDLHALA